ncbi:GNAT family N-acetyltransferase [Cohnella thailandensis]|uniref:GNAT family N-acetyltransferase n=1 Tax=Cohnella thailandensis TaxID=557557 RepID=A0A841SXT8_9BACL|nr:GNAT family N-acetyltransferase [Cohnella thailandensis]MBB6635436.1 GNAT family N-acetyltransferase [Cohnella thailandensis]MBP1974816.1 GNAT superfamily N-acetyltransferase [Cohnella thailandensis]
MIEIKRADSTHVQGIAEVCAQANRATYGEIYAKEYLEEIIAKYYTPERIAEEVGSPTRAWGGYWVAVEKDRVIGAGGGGMIGDAESEIFALYVSPDRRNEGIGSLLIEAITAQQKEFGAAAQWISVQKGNHKGIPFYEARGFELQGEEEEEHGYLSLRYKRVI